MGQVQWQSRAEGRWDPWAWVRRAALGATWLLGVGWGLAGLADEVPFGEGRLFRIERAAEPVSYVFATLHAHEPEVVILPEAAERAFGESRALVLELVPDEAAGARALAAMLLPQGQRLRELIGPALFDQTLQAAGRLGVGEAALEGFKPWAVATLLSVPPAAGGEFLDQRLYSRARDLGKRVLGLETVEEQLGLFDNLSLGLQLSLLEEALAEQDQLPERYRALRDAYLRGDLAELLRLNGEYLAGGDGELRAFVQDRVIEGRNRQMVERLEGLGAAGPWFVAVGALHLPGEQGMLRLLQARGWRVERVPLR